MTLHPEALAEVRRLLGPESADAPDDVLASTAMAQRVSLDLHLRDLGIAVREAGHATASWCARLTRRCRG